MSNWMIQSENKMKIKLRCFHGPEDDFSLGEAYDMEESILGEFDRMVFRCPECGKEIFVTYEVETPYAGPV